MDILDFINSRDVRNHLEKINYKLSFLESAYIIYQSKYKTISQKHSAWEGLIAEEDVVLDEKVGQRWGKKVYGSEADTIVYKPSTYGMRASRLIQRHIKEEKELLDYFYEKTANCVYTLEYTFKGQRREYKFDNEDSGVFFSDFKSAEAYFKKEFCDDFDEKNDEFNVTGYSITKKMFYQPENKGQIQIKVDFNMDGQAMYLHRPYEISVFFPENIKRIISDAVELSTEIDFFERMWFDIPTPFKKGDIVVEKPTSREAVHVPFVYMYGVPELFKKRFEEDGTHREGYDYTDMNAGGWTIGFDDMDEIYDDAMGGYLDLEYYREEYRDTERLLPLLAEHIKGNIDIWQYEILKEEIMRDLSENDCVKDMMEFDETVARIMEGRNETVVLLSKQKIDK